MTMSKCGAILNLAVKGLKIDFHYKIKSTVCKKVLLKSRRHLQDVAFYAFAFGRRKYRTGSAMSYKEKKGDDDSHLQRATSILFTGFSHLVFSIQIPHHTFHWFSNFSLHQNH